MSPSLVAMVETEPAHATLIDYHLKKMGINVQSFESGQAFLHTYTTAPVDVYMISDQLDDLPIELVLQEIETLNEKKTIIIMTTSHLTPYQSDLHDILYIRKPFSLKEFRDCVEPLFLQSNCV
ncbi:hypothetical protein AJ85_16340 [Alkalihalobacillus alcalophilus ATCC 27647 = CGMCC 1.3604]|uniref:Response regulatory domain-containing protein n=1 Tax=Alkalihalobacillus alcalophilus ATCC 27647 = CGMCC 1.3604 TaxID=1218173 RepID=A0A094YVQ8_ALKAL|nr:response regulator [Alkalihalobacillus alcalophilus]KGA97602.1 hypothetical protein BALCAV_0209110 [Alkalihalobacillus alcalophilus ATCC 27647 = CGMCC 1.3604]MED1561389.1 response regulator transcription factor [Alkalihalobacillus alcalophilus]THG92187.1 hypothetical protein AJ85_16340 [Alkalihalobacillus alcalophilus ATCC 27647 = CGMCC 1.3604]